MTSRSLSLKEPLSGCVVAELWISGPEPVGTPSSSSVVGSR